MTENINEDDEYLEGSHVALSNASACPWAQMVIVLNEGLALSAVHGSRRTEAAYLLVPKPTPIPRLLLRHPLEQTGISAADAEE